MHGHWLAVSQLTNVISFEKKFISRAYNESLAEPLNAAEGDTENVFNYVTVDPLSIAQSMSILADEMQTAIEITRMFKYSSICGERIADVPFP